MTNVMVATAHHDATSDKLVPRRAKLSIPAITGITVSRLQLMNQTSHQGNGGPFS